MKSEFMSRKIEKIIVNSVISSISEKEESHLQKWLNKKKRNRQIYDDFTVLLKMVHQKNNLMTHH